MTPYFYRKTDKHGNLVLVAAGGTRQYLTDLGDEIQSDAAMVDAFEHLTANGLHWVHPGDIGALSEAPILADGDINEESTNIWYYNDYMLRSPLQDLRDTGRVVFLHVPHE
jgi:hypothetical protein